LVSRLRAGGQRFDFRFISKSEREDRKLLFSRGDREWQIALIEMLIDPSVSGKPLGSSDRISTHRERAASAWPFTR
jgi:hypothetical protein